MFILNCNDPSLANFIVVFSNVINFLLILVPISLIISLGYNFILMMSKPDDKKIPKRLINSCIALLFLFFIPLIVNVTLKIIGDSNDFSSCYNGKSNANYNSTYIDTSDGKKKNIISDDTYENGRPNVSGDNTPISNDLNGLFTAAKKADRHTYSRGYHYADARSFDGTDMLDASGQRSASCDRGVALTLYFFGYTDMQPNTLNLGNLTNYLPQKGWTKITSCNNLKPGDIVFYDRNHNNAMEASDHTFLIGESLNLKYDWGSDASIKHQGNYASGMPYNFQINCNEFGWAYRMP